MTAPAKLQEVLNGAAPAGFKLLELGSAPADLDAAPNIISDVRICDVTVGMDVTASYFGEDPNGAAPAVQPLEPGSVPAAPNIIVTELEFVKNKRTKNGKLRMSTFNGHPFLEAPRQAADGATQHIWHVRVPLRDWPSVQKVVCVVQQSRVLEVKVDDSCLWATDEWSNGDGTYSLIGSPLKLMPYLICPHCNLPKSELCSIPESSDEVEYVEVELGSASSSDGTTTINSKLSSIPDSSVEVESVEVELGPASSSDGTPTINSCWAHSYRWHLLASYRWHLSCHVTVIN